MFNRIKRFLANPILIFYFETKMPRGIKSGYEFGFISTQKRYSKPYRKDLIQHDLAVSGNIDFLLANKEQVFRKRGPTSVLDVGCGDGKYSKIFTDRCIFPYGTTYTGTELNEALVKSNQQKYKGVKFMQSEVERIAAKTSTFDVVFCSGVLHYSLQNWKNGLSELARVSKKNVIVSRMPLTKNKENIYLRQIVISVYGVTIYYFVVPGKKNFEAAVVAAGLKVVKAKESSEKYHMLGVDRAIPLYQYLLQKV